MATKIYRNTSDKTLNVLGVDEIAPGEQVSVTSEYPTPVILENYPGLIDVGAEEEAGTLDTTQETQATPDSQEATQETADNTQTGDSNEQG